MLTVHDSGADPAMILPYSYESNTTYNGTQQNKMQK